MPTKQTTLNTINATCSKTTAELIGINYLQLNPFWQRKYECWKPSEYTKLIETFLLERNMNPIWTISHPEDNTDCVLDGMHRLTTAIKFIRNEFYLDGKFLDELEYNKYHKKYFKELEKEDREIIKNYNCAFNLLDSSYYTDGDKRANMYNILNRSSVQLNDYEYLTNIYHNFYDILQKNKKQFKTLFNKKDERGHHEYELLDIYILSLSSNLQSWSSLSKLRMDWQKKTFKESEKGATSYIEEFGGFIDTQLCFIKKIKTKLEERKVFDVEKKIFNSNYIIYKFIIARLACKFKNINQINRYIDICLVDLLKLINCDDIITEIMGKNPKKGGRNAKWQKCLLERIDKIIDSKYDSKNPKNKRIFSKEVIKKKFYDEQNKCCNICKKKQNIQNCQGDHIIEYSDGGTTDYENLQVLCIPCHQKKTSNYMSLK